MRLERKMAEDPCALLAAAEIRVLGREVRRTLMSSFRASKRTWSTAKTRLGGMRSVRDVAQRVAHVGFVMCRLRSRYLSTDCERLRTAA